MLEARLQPLLKELKAKDKEQKLQYTIVKRWFESHEDNLAESIADMAFICKLDWQERRLLTYPVMGNWYLDRMRSFKPETPHQDCAFQMLKGLVRERRFNNYHTESFYEDRDSFNRRFDEFNSHLLGDTRRSMQLHRMLAGINQGVLKGVYSLNKMEDAKYEVGLGHGLAEPSSLFSFLTWYFEANVRNSNARGRLRPLGLTIMVVDDQQPEAWYQRMISVGFKHKEGQQGFFFNCGSALRALRSGQYDVILTDLDLGPRRMDGIEFVEKAYDIQCNKGITPRISVFSYDMNGLEEADRVLRHARDYPRLFHQVNNNHKARFTAIDFRLEVLYTLPRNP